jgi:hypothetical protein
MIGYTADSTSAGEGVPATTARTLLSATNVGRRQAASGEKGGMTGEKGEGKQLLLQKHARMQATDLVENCWISCARRELNDAKVTCV